MTIAVNEFELSAAAYPHGRVAVLLARYPRLSRRELDEVISFVQRASPAELRNLRSNPALPRNLDRLLSDQSARLQHGSTPIPWLLVAALLGVVAVWLA